MLIQIGNTWCARNLFMFFELYGSEIKMYYFYLLKVAKDKFILRNLKIYF